MGHHRQAGKHLSKGPPRAGFSFFQTRVNRVSTHLINWEGQAMWRVQFIYAAALIAGLLAATPSSAQLSPTANYASELQDFGVPPQNALHLGAPHAPTPLTAPGAKTITTAELYSQLSARQPMVLLYVNGNIDGGAIAGSHWLKGAGLGQSFTDVVQARLAEKVGQLSSGNKAAPIVTYCFDAHCWLSYNATLRLINAGFTNVSWYRGGREAWKAAGLPLAPVAEDAW